MSFEQVPSLPVLYNCYIPWLTALAAPLEDQGSISSTNVVWFTAVSIQFQGNQCPRDRGILEQ